MTMKETTLEDKVMRDINVLFIYLKRLSKTEKKWNFSNFIVSNIEKELASNKDFYSVKGRKTKEMFKKQFVGKLMTDDTDLFNLVDIELDSPLSIFKTFLQYDIPDITMSYHNIKIQFNSFYFKNIEVPHEIEETYKYFIDHFVSNLKYIAEEKLDRSNGIMDTTFEIFRFNLVHQSLNAFNSPIISIRKHIKNVSKVIAAEDNRSYENGLGVTTEVVEEMKKNVNKSFCIFGDVGSGKTTLLRYLINHDFENKRNVCVIEDSAELFIQTPLSFVTNESYGIHELFVASLRQNPSHLIIGETRTQEIVDIMETGLTACVATTIHAQSFEKAMERIYFMSSPKGISKADIVDLTSSSFHMFIHIEKRIIRGVWIRNEEKNKSIYDRYDRIF